jgi:hypothetical protein
MQNVHAEDREHEVRWIHSRKYSVRLTLPMGSDFGGVGPWMAAFGLGIVAVEVVDRELEVAV